jgi:hypothetical protein
MRQLVVRPSEFFEVESEDPSLLASVLVVFATGVALNLNTLFTLPAMGRALSAQAAQVAQTVALIGAAGGTVGTFGLWFIYAGSFHTLSILFDGEGEFRETFLLIGWGFFPLAVHGILGGLVFQYTLSAAGAVPQDPQQFSAFVTALGRQPPLLASSAVRFLFLAWQAWLWAHAVREARDLSLQEALLTVSLPVLVTVVVNARRFLQTLSAA